MDGVWVVVGIDEVDRLKAVDEVWGVVGVEVDRLVVVIEGMEGGTVVLVALNKITKHLNIVLTIVYKLK